MPIGWGRGSFAFTAVALPALDTIPSNFSPDLVRVVQRRARILSALNLPAFHVLPDFFLGFFRLGHCDRHVMNAVTGVRSVHPVPLAPIGRTIVGMPAIARGVFLVQTNHAIAPGIGIWLEPKFLAGWTIDLNHSLDVPLRLGGLLGWRCTAGQYSCNQGSNN